MTGAHYNALGEITSDTLSDGETETWTYNDKRGRATSYSAVNGTTPVYSYSVSYAPNSNILTANDSVNGNWKYGYDEFDRLLCSNLVSNSNAGCSPTSGTPTYTYDYDRFGNRWDQTGPVSFHATFTGNNPGSPANTNRIDGYTYDAAGNLTFDNVHSYYYDAENRLVQIDGTPGYCATLASGGTPTGSLPTTCNMYDALGRRVMHADNTTPDDCSHGTGNVWYDYDLQDRPIFLTNNYSNGQCHQEFYAGSRHLVSWTGVATFSHSDWLGTERVRSTATYTETCTSLPFGDNLHCSQSNDPGVGDSILHFTAKERDGESGLDNFGARYLTSSMGRFMTPDPGNAGVVNADPQSWNAYSYVRNNPINLTDPTGAVMCRPANDAEKGQGVTLVCDVTDAQYVNSSKADQAAWDKAGYTHYDCSCDTDADKAAWAERKGNVSNGYIGDALVFLGALAIVRGLDPGVPPDPRLPQDKKRESDYPTLQTPTREMARLGLTQIKMLR